MATKKQPKKAPANAGAYELSDETRFDTLFDQFGNPTGAAVTSILESSEKAIQSMLQLNASAVRLFDRVKVAPGLDAHDRDAILDDVFAVLESAIDVQAWHEHAYGMVRYRFANHRTFTAKANASKSAVTRPKVVAMREIETHWVSLGKPEVADFAKNQAVQYQLKGIDLSERGILNALRRFKLKNQGS